MAILYRQILLTLVILLQLCAVAHSKPLLGRDAVVRGLEAVDRAADASEMEGRWLGIAPFMEELSVVEQRTWLKRLLQAPDGTAYGVRLMQAMRRHQRSDELRSTASDRGRDRLWWLSLLEAPHAVSLSDGFSSLGRLEDTTVGSGEGLDWTQQELMLDGRTLPMGDVSSDRARLLVAGATVTVSRPSRVVLWLGGVGDLAVHLDGREVGRVRGIEAPRVDQMKIPLSLTRGSHVLLVTMAVQGGALPALYTRWSDSRGRPVKHLRLDAPPGVVHLPAPTDRAPSTDALSWTDGIDFGGDTPRDGLLRSVARRALGIPDEGGGAQARWPTLESAVTDAASAGVDVETLVLAVAQIPRLVDRATVLDQLLRLRPGDPLLLVNRAQVALDRDRVFLSQTLLETVPPGRRTPAWGLVASRLARVRGQPKMALTLLESTLSEPAEVLELERASVLMELGRPDRAVSLLDSLYKALPGDSSMGAGLVEALRASGRASEALQVLDGIARRRPDVPTYALEGARLARHLGAMEQARALVDGVRARSWAEPEMLGAVAELYEQLGEVEIAAASWQRALELRPSDARFRAGWERLQPPLEESLPFETAPEAASRWHVPTSSATPYTVLSEETHVELHADGSVTRFEQRLLRVHRVPEERGERLHRILFEPERDEVRVLSAGVLRGKLWLKNTEREIYEITEQEFGLYYDLRQMVVPFDDLMEGDTVVLRYRVHQARRAADFGWIGLLQGPYPKHKVLFTVRAPGSLPIRSRLTSPPGSPGKGLDITERRLVEGKAVQVRVEAGDLPSITREPLGPPLSELSAVWQVSSIATWTEVAAGYETLLRSQRVISAEMRAWVRQHVDKATAADGSMSRPLLLESMVRDLVRDIRYVGLEFGVHGVVPYRTDQVWSRRFGDCKDQALLMVSLLQEAGLEAQVILLRTASQGRLLDPLPSLSFFDHAVVYLPDLSLYVDPTARYYGLGMLPEADQGAQVLHVGDGHNGLAFTDVPSDGLGDNHVEGDYTVVLATDGEASIEGTVSLRGVQGAKRRSFLQDQGARDKRVELLLNQRYPGLSVTRFDLQDLERRDRPLRLSFVGETPWLAKRLAGTLQVASPTGFGQFAPTVANLQERRSTLVLGAVASVHSRSRYLVPSGWRLRQLPRGGEENTRFGSWSVHWRQEAGSVVVEARISYGVSRIEPADYPSFRAFLRRLDDHLREPLVWIEQGAGEGE